MYWGSVKFFKHIIYLSIILVLAIVIITLFSVSNKAFKFFKDDDKEVMSNYVIDASADQNIINHYPDSMEYSYQKEYPQLYARQSNVNPIKPNTCYLTFDDGPSKLTNEVLDILDKNSIKATFFVVVNENTDYNIIKDAINRGHSIGIHSCSHNYKNIYRDVDSFLNDLDTANNLLIENTGYKSTIIRFPGGSVNSYNSGFYSELISELLRRNYHYFDWNISSQDALANITKEQIIENVEKGLQLYSNNNSRIVVLAHDSNGKYATIESLQTIIDKIKDNGFTFETLDNSVPIMSFAYKENN